MVSSAVVAGVVYKAGNKTDTMEGTGVVCCLDQDDHHK
jgi:hypothetical protein